MTPWLLTCLVLVSAAPAQAEVPLEQALGFATAAQAHGPSPLLGMMALRSGVLANIRLFGNYTSTPRPGLPPHPQLDPKDNCPQDAIAAVVQCLFPSPDGIYLAHNEYRIDPIGLMAREAALDPQGPGGLRRLGKLLQASAGYRRTLVRGSAGSLPPIAGLEAGDGGSSALAEASRAFREVVERILSGQGSHAGHVSGVQFKTLRADFARFLQEALLLEATGQDRRYPPDTVEAALLAYAWRVAGSADQLRAALEGQGAAPESKARFDPAFFERHFPHFLERLESKAPGPPMTAEEAALFLAGEQAYRSPICELIGYRPIAFREQRLPDCGETSLRNLLNIAFSSHGELDPVRIKAFFERMRALAGGPGESKAETKAPAPGPFLARLEQLERFYLVQHPRLSGHDSETAHRDWLALLADLNAAEDPLPIAYEKTASEGGRTLGFNLRGTGVYNLLNLIAHLLPDGLLNRPWPEAEDARRELAAAKLTRLCELLSCDGRKFDWSAGGDKTLANEFPRLAFTLEGRPGFTWRIDYGHYLLTPVQDPSFAALAAKVAGRTWEPWLDLWVRRHHDQATRAGGDAQVPLPVAQPPDLFGYQLASEWEAPRVLRGILDAREPGLAPSFQLIASRSLPLDGEALEKLGRIVQDYPWLAEDPRFYPVRGILAQPRKELDQLLCDLVRPLGLTYSSAVEVLLAHGANPRLGSAEGDPLVCIAARRRETRVLQKLLAAGAEVDARDRWGRTPLAGAMAAFEAAIPIGEIAGLLIQAGADLEAADDAGETPLLLAAAGADLEKVQVLLAAGAKVGAGDRAGRTPLMHAALNPDGRAVAEALLQAGADPEARDGSGRTALGLARAEGTEAMAAWLQERVASPAKKAEPASTAGTGQTAPPKASGHG